MAEKQYQPSVLQQIGRAVTSQVPIIVRGPQTIRGNQAVVGAVQINATNTTAANRSAVSEKDQVYTYKVKNNKPFKEE